jgi:hypothetical protein
MESKLPFSWGISPVLMLVCAGRVSNLGGSGAGHRKSTSPNFVEVQCATSGKMDGQWGPASAVAHTLSVDMGDNGATSKL